MNGRTFQTRHSTATVQRVARAACSPTRPRFEGLGADDLSNAVMELLPWNMRRRLDAEAPTHFEAPTGTQVPIDYGAEAGPTIAIRVQELFGLSRHPSIADGRVPLVIELALARAPARAGDARSARLLARKLCCGEKRKCARSLSADIPGRTIRPTRCRRGGSKRPGT